MVDHCDSGCCATGFAGWEKTLESAEAIPTAQEMPISHLASFISATTLASFIWVSPDERHRSDFPGFPEGPFVLAARSLAIRARPGVVDAEVAVLLRIWAYFPRQVSL